MEFDQSQIAFAKNYFVIHFNIKLINPLSIHSACVLPLISIKDFNDLSLNEFYGNEWKALYYLSVV